MGILLNMKIQELETYTQSQFEELKQLMTELSDRVSFSEHKLDDVLADSNCHLYVIMDNGHIIGCATLCVFHSPTGTKASIEDVVVSSAIQRTASRQTADGARVGSVENICSDRIASDIESQTHRRQHIIPISRI